MISIVVCSINNLLAEQVKSNINNTIGVPWEAIIIDNSNPSRSITEVYNDGAGRAAYPIICFVHEDVEFLTADWGKLIVGYFDSDSKLGMVGIAGARYKSKTISGWMTNVEEFDRYNITHRDSNGKNIRMFFDQPPAEALKEVVTLDGVFLCTRRQVIDSIKFDQEFLKGFHLYDLDISYRISRLYKVAVSFEIDLIHFTEGGDFGDNWINNTLKWHAKYERELPSCATDVDLKRQNDVEHKVRLFWMKRLRTERISFTNKLRWIWASKAIIDIRLWPHMTLLFIFKNARKVIKYGRK